MLGKEEGSSQVQRWRAATEYFALHDYPNAIATFYSIDQNTLASFNIAFIYQSERFFGHSLRFFDDSIRLNPYLLIAYFQRCYSYFLLGKVEEALLDLSTALQLMGRHVFIDYSSFGLNYQLHRSEVLFNRAMAYSETGDQVSCMRDLYDARASAVSGSQLDLINEAINSNASIITLFSLPRDLCFGVSKVVERPPVEPKSEPLNYIQSDETIRKKTIHLNQQIPTHNPEIISKYQQTNNKASGKQQQQQQQQSTDLSKSKSKKKAAPPKPTPRGSSMAAPKDLQLQSFIVSPTPADFNDIPPPTPPKDFEKIEILIEQQKPKIPKATPRVSSFHPSHGGGVADNPALEKNKKEIIIPEIPTLTKSLVVRDAVNKMKEVETSETGQLAEEKIEVDNTAIERGRIVVEDLELTESNLEFDTAFDMERGGLEESTEKNSKIEDLAEKNLEVDNIVIEMERIVVEDLELTESNLEVDIAFEKERGGLEESTEKNSKIEDLAEEKIEVDNTAIERERMVVEDLELTESNLEVDTAFEKERGGLEESTEKNSEIENLADITLLNSISLSNPPAESKSPQNIIEPIPTESIVKFKLIQSTVESTPIETVDACKLDNSLEIAQLADDGNILSHPYDDRVLDDFLDESYYFRSSSVPAQKLSEYQADGIISPSGFKYHQNLPLPPIPTALSRVGFKSSLGVNSRPSSLASEVHIIEYSSEVLKPAIPLSLSLIAKLDFEEDSAAIPAMGPNSATLEKIEKNRILFSEINKSLYNVTNNNSVFLNNENEIFDFQTCDSDTLACFINASKLEDALNFEDEGTNPETFAAYQSSAMFDFYRRTREPSVTGEEKQKRTGMSMSEHIEAIDKELSLLKDLNRADSSYSTYSISKEPRSGSSSRFSSDGGFEEDVALLSITQSYQQSSSCTSSYSMTGNSSNFQQQKVYRSEQETSNLQSSYHHQKRKQESPPQLLSTTPSSSQHRSPSSPQRSPPRGRLQEVSLPPLQRGGPQLHYQRAIHNMPMSQPCIEVMEPINFEIPSKVKLKVFLNKGVSISFSISRDLLSFD